MNEENQTRTRNWLVYNQRELGLKKLDASRRKIVQLRENRENLTDTSYMEELNRLQEERDQTRQTLDKIESYIRDFDDLVNNQVQFNIAGRLLNTMPRTDLTQSQRQIRDVLGELSEEAEEYLKQSQNITFPNGLEDEIKETSASIVDWYQSTVDNIEELLTLDTNSPNYQSRREDLLNLIQDKRSYFPERFRNFIDINLANLPSDEQERVKQTNVDFIDEDYYLSSGSEFRTYRKVMQRLRNAENASEIESILESEEESLSPLPYNVRTEIENTASFLKQNNQQNDNQLVLNRRIIEQEQYSNQIGHQDEEVINYISQFDQLTELNTQLHIFQKRQDILGTNLESSINELETRISNYENTLSPELEAERKQSESYLLEFTDKIIDDIVEYHQQTNKESSQRNQARIDELEKIIQDEYSFACSMSMQPRYMGTGNIIRSQIEEALGDRSVFLAQVYPSIDPETVLEAHHLIMNDIKELKESSITEERKKELQKNMNEAINELNTYKGLQNEYSNELNNISLNTINDRQDSMLNPNFNPHGMEYEDYKKMFNKELKQYKKGSREYNQLTQIDNDIEQKRKKEKQNKNFVKDVNGNVMYYPGTSIPQPRLQNWDETTEDYNNWLNEVFSKELENGKYFTKDIENSNKDIKLLENKDRKLLENKDVKLLENKEDIKRLENKYETVKRDYVDVIDDIYLKMEEAGYEIKKKDVQIVNASNIKVLKGFVNNVKEKKGLYYKITTAAYELPRGIISLGVKMFSKLRANKERKARVKCLQDIVQSLPESDLEILYREYRGREVTKRTDQDSLNLLLNGAIAKYARGKAYEYALKNEVLTAKAYLTMSNVEIYKQKINDPNTSEKDKKKYQNLINTMTEDSAKIVEDYFKNYDIQNTYLHGDSGVHSQQEDFRSSRTKASNKGWMFAKKYDTDYKLMHEERAIRNKTKQAVVDVKNGNKDKNVDALKALIDYHKFYKDETKTKKGFLRGIFSTGKREGGVAVEENNYEEDKSLQGVRNICLAALFGVSQIAESMKTADMENVIRQQKENMKSVNEAGQTINNYNQTWAEGMKDSAYSNSQALGDLLERHAFTESKIKTGRSFGDVYYDLDSEYHELTKRNVYDISTSYDRIILEYSTGAINDTEMLHQVSEFAKGSYNKLMQEYNNMIPILQQYGVDKYSTQELLNVINETAQTSPDAVGKLYDSLVNLSEYGDKLQEISNISTEQLNIISQFSNDPNYSDLFKNIFFATGVFSGINKATNDVINSYNKKTEKINNDMDEMLSDYENLGPNAFLQKYQPQQTQQTSKAK